MNGEMLLYGYKFERNIHLNFGRRAVLIPQGEYGTGHDIFQFLQKFFNGRDFSDCYLDAGLGMALNGDAMYGNEYEVFYIPPVVDTAEATKVLRKTLLGKLWRQMFREESARLEVVQKEIDRAVVQPLNAFLHNYHIHYTNDGGDILTYCKLLSLTGVQDGAELILEEVSQYDMKRLLVDTVGRLEVSSPRILLLELPEYALTAGQTVWFFQQLQASPIEYILILTHDDAVLQAVSNIYYYHYITPQGICTFDDWEEILPDMLDYDKREVESYILRQLLTEVRDDRLRQFIQENIR